VTKASANPRRYSRGADKLDPDQPLSVYLSIRVDPLGLDSALERLEYLADKHTEASMRVAAYRRYQGRVFLTIEVAMGPARQALRGTSAQLHSGYALLWDIVKTLFYAHPILCSPPGPEERASVDQMGELFPARPSTVLTEVHSA
jgi:hypothetical protein